MSWVLRFTLLDSSWGLVISAFCLVWTNTHDFFFLLYKFVNQLHRIWLIFSSLLFLALCFVYVMNLFVF